MKAIFTFLSLFFPFFVFGQNSVQTLNYSIVVQGEKWIAQNQPDSTLTLAQNLLSQTNLYPFQKRQALYLLGKASSALGRPEDAVDPLQKSIVLSQKSHDDPLLLKSLIAASSAMGDKENLSLDSVMFYLEGAKVLAENLHDTASLARIYINTANVFYLLENYDQALSNNYSCEALLKYSTFEYEKALNFHGKGNSLLDKYIREEKEDILLNAQQSFRSAIETFQKLGNKINEAYSRKALAGSFLYSDLDKASPELKQSIKLGIELNDQEILLDGYYTLSTLYEMEDNKAGAVEALEKLNGILQKSGSSEDVAFLKEQFSNNDTKISSALINKKINIFKKQIENESLALYLKVLSVISLLILGLFAYYRQKNKLLQERYKFVQEKQELMQENEKSLQAELRNLLEEFLESNLEGAELIRARLTNPDKFEEKSDKSLQIERINIERGIEIKILLSENKVNEVIEDLLNLTSTKDISLYNELILLKSRFSKNNKNNNQALIDLSEFRLEELRIIKSLIDIIDSMYKHKS